MKEYIESTNYIKRNGQISTAPKFIIELNGSQYGSMCFSDINDIDYRFYLEYGWDWDKKEIILVKVINNISGEEFEFTWKFGKIQEQDKWKGEMYQSFIKSEELFNNILKTDIGNGYYSFGNQSQIRANIIKHIRCTQCTTSTAI